MGLASRDYYRQQENPLTFSVDRYSMVTILVVINVVIFLLDAFTPKVNPGAAVSDQMLSHWMAIRSDRPWHLWNYLTYGFAHASLASKTSVMHVLGNMFALFMLGRGVEEALGRKEFLRFYLIAIVVCGVGYAVPMLMMKQNFGLVGASGGVSAVIALFIFMFPRATLSIWGVIPMPAWVLGVLLLVSNLGIAMDRSSNTAWEAHLIGFAFGAAYYYFKWDFSSIPLPSFKRSSGPKLKIHDPDGDIELQNQADKILQKISEQGESSLSKRERKILSKYSESVRNRRK